MLVQGTAEKQLLLMLSPCLNNIKKKKKLPWTFLVKLWTFLVKIVELFAEIVDLFSKRAVLQNPLNPPWLRACYVITQVLTVEVGDGD